MERTTENRRRSSRRKLSVRVSGVDERDLALAYGKTRDISLHGLYIELLLTGTQAQAIINGAMVRLRFRPPTSSLPIEVSAQIVRVLREADRTPRGIGVDFVELEPESKQAIEQYLESIS